MDVCALVFDMVSVKIIIIIIIIVVVVVERVSKMILSVSLARVRFEQKS